MKIQFHTPLISPDNKKNMFSHEAIAKKERKQFFEICIKAITFDYALILLMLFTSRLRKLFKMDKYLCKNVSLKHHF